jgi:hypothetical protein
MAAEDLVGRRDGVGLARLVEHPGRTIVLAWRMSSARGRELAMLADTIARVVAPSARTTR